MKLEAKIIIGLLGVIAVVMIVGVARMGEKPSPALATAHPPDAKPSKSDLMAEYEAAKALYEAAVTNAEKAEERRLQYMRDGGDNPKTLELMASQAHDNTVELARLEKAKDLALQRANE